MSDVTEVRPFETFAAGDGSVDWFMLPFDKRGSCTGPHTREHLLEVAADPATTDVFVFSHGWNNDWNVATDRYRDFITGYLAQRQRLGRHGRAIRPLLVGIFWPSTALVFGDERGLRIAGADPGPEATGELDALIDAVDPRHAVRLRDLVGREELTGPEARELAGIVAPALGAADVDEGPAHADDPDVLVDLWRSTPSLAPAADDEDPDAIAARLQDFGRVGVEVGPGDELAGASLLSRLDPRQIVRLVTVRMMKDRAGTVGSFGVGSFLVDLLEASDETRCRVHLVGHSYGAKVCLSAICHPDRLPRPVDSLLLLQPAVSHRCFADDDLGRGGYADAPARVDLPILSTFSRHDVPLTKVFHLAVRRRDDRDELRIAAGEPSRYAALGGVGPHGLGVGSRNVPVLDPGGDHYDLGAGGPGVLGIDASATVSGHGDISNPSTWWALDNLVAADRIGLP